MPTPRHHALLLLLAALPLLLAVAATAQPNESRDKGNRGGSVPGAIKPPSFSAPMVVLLVALVAAFFFIGFFSIYIRQCGRAGSTGPGGIPAAALLALSRQEEQQNGRQRGLDPAVVASFPTMSYAEARELRDGGKDAVLECAVCLSEFDDGEELRLLPKCSHAFHPDCIGEWLAGHVTCPVCRCSLAPEESATAETNSSGEASGEQAQEVAIDVNRDGHEEEEERRREAMELERIGSQRRAVRSRSGRPGPLPRSHSTGHSLAARLDGDLERFTLRLPEHVRRGMVAAGEESLRRTEPREGRGASGARSARIGRSDRWPSFIARTFSSRVPFRAASRRAPDAEAAAGSTTPAATARTMREKAAAAADGSVSSAKGSVRFDCLGGASVARVGAVAGDSEEEEEKAIIRQV